MAAIVLAGALAFAMAAMLKARDAAQVGLELRKATMLAAYTLQQPLAAVGVVDGRTADFTWRLQLAATGQPGRVEICRRSVRVTSLKHPTRAFELGDLEPCPPKADA